MIAFACDQCQARLEAPEVSAGGSVACGTCGAFVTVPPWSTVGEREKAAASPAPSVARRSTSTRALPTGRPPWFVAVEGEPVIPGLCCCCGKMEGRYDYEPLRGRRTPRRTWHFRVCEPCSEWMEDAPPVRSAKVEELEAKKKNYLTLMIVFLIVFTIVGIVFVILYTQLDGQIAEARARHRRRLHRHAEDAPPGAAETDPVEYVEGSEHGHAFEFWNREFCAVFLERNKSAVRESSRS